MRLAIVALAFVLTVVGAGCALNREHYEDGSWRFGPISGCDAGALCDD